MLERAVQTNPTLLRYASAKTKRKKCWELLPKKFDRFQTLRNNSQRYATTCNGVPKRTQHHGHLTIFGVVGQQRCVRLYVALSKQIERKRHLDCEWILFLLSGKLSSHDWPLNRYKMKKINYNMSHVLTIRTKLTIHYYTIIQYIYMFFYISSEDNYIRKLVIVIVLSHAHDQQNKLTKMK